MKKALITGASKSIGFEVARQLLAQGHYIYLGSRNQKNGSEAVAKLKAEGFTNVECIEIDVTDKSSILNACKTVSAKTSSLDILINNAGISGGFPQPATTTSVEAIQTVFDTNFFGVINVTQAFLELLKKSEAPRIVNVTSGLASLTLHSDPSWAYYEVKGGAYGPSKTALNAYTIVLAHELRDTAFKVNVVDPGYTATDFNHHRGHGSVQSAAAIIVKYALVGADGPTGKFFSNDIEDSSQESPW